MSDSEDADLRAHLVLAWLLGIGLMRDVTGKEICELVLGAARTLLERIR